MLFLEGFHAELDLPLISRRSLLDVRYKRI